MASSEDRSAFEARMGLAYDATAGDYAAAREPEYWGAEASAFEALLPGRNVLDIGCGAGRDAAMFVRHGLRYTGIDLSEGMLACARGRAPTATFHRMSFSALAFQEGCFDGFWAAASFLHAPRADLPKLLAEAARVIRPGGAGFVALKERTAEQARDGWIVDRRWTTPVERYFAFYEPAEVEVAARGAGLETVDLRRRDEGTWFSLFFRKWA